MLNDFINLCIFSLLAISIINRLTSDDGDFVCCHHVISEMQHATETRLPFYRVGSPFFGNGFSFVESAEFYCEFGISYVAP